MNLDERLLCNRRNEDLSDFFNSIGDGEPFRAGVVRGGFGASLPVAKIALMTPPGPKQTLAFVEVGLELAWALGHAGATMKPGMRVAATLVLLLLLLPVLLALSRNGVLVFPLWWAVAYFVFRACFPQSKQASVPALAVLGGSLAYVIALSLFWSGAAMGLNLHAVAVMIGMFWLYFTQSRIAAIALIVVQVVVSVTGAQALLQFDFAGAFANRSAAVGTLGALFASVFSHVFAIIFLTIFIMRRPEAGERVSAPA